MTGNGVISSTLPLWIVLLPFITGSLIFVAGLVSEKAVRTLFLLTAVVPAFFTALLYYPVVVEKNIVVQYFPGVLPPAGLSFRLDIMGMFLLILFCVFGLVLFIYTLEYFRGKANLTRVLGSLALSYTGCLGVAMAGNIFSFFLFFEFMSVLFFISITHERTEAAVNATLKFLFITIFGGVALFLGVALTYVHAGSGDFGTGGVFQEVSPGALMAFVAFIVAFGVKTATVPLHIWMPDAYAEAPVPVATLSSGMLLKTGAFGLIRVFYDLFGIDYLQQVNWNYILVTLACISILYGSVNAVAQDDIIRRLAYSGIAQVGYITLGIALLNEAAFIGNLFHLFAHAFMKGTLFLCAGVVILKTGIRNVSEMKGVGRRYPVTMLAFTIASLTAVGLPPFNVFITKWHLGLGVLEAGMPLILLVLLASSMLNAAYYLPIAYGAFLGTGEEKQPGLERRGWSFEVVQPGLILPILALTFGCVVFTITRDNWPLEMVREAAGNIFMLKP